MTLSLTVDNQMENVNNLVETPFILNKYANNNILDAQGIISQLQQLSMHGVSTPLINQTKVRKLKYQNVYLIPVFQQKILGIFKQKKNNTNSWLNSEVFNYEKFNLEQVKSFRSSREERRIKKQVIQAVYALNIDYALVKVGVTVGARPWILYVNTDSNIEVIKQMFNKAISEFMNLWQKNVISGKKKVKIGADPEFVLQGPTGKLILASTYLPKKGIVGCDQIWVNRDRTQLPLGEFRPLPSDDIKQFIINLYKSMLLGSKKIQNTHIKWVAGAMPIKGYPLGGHIHFSNVWLNSFLLRALDNYVTLPITLLESENAKLRRPKYGFLGDYREKYYGGFEYRTLPSWLLSPAITKGTLALAKLVVENYMHLYQNPLSDYEVQKAYYNSDKIKLKPIVYDLLKELKELKDYSLYKKYLEPLENLIRQNYTWDENTDIRKIWYLPPYHTNINKKH